MALVYEVEDIVLERGRPLPLGATSRPGGINFAIFSRHATEVWLLLFAPGADAPIREFKLDPRRHRTGDVWHAHVKGARPGIEYGYHMGRETGEEIDLNPIHRFDPDKVLVDPYAHVITGGETWGELTPAQRAEAREGHVKRRRGFVREESFDWGDDAPLNIPMSETVICELHVRGFTRHQSSGVKKGGTYLGLAECIPYLQKLGVTAVELLPVAEFEEADTSRANPRTGERLLNFWGYHPIGFFAPNASYSAGKAPGDQALEFKRMVKSFHEAGIEVILDVVFNHTAEGDERGPTISFRGIDNPTYYMLGGKTGEYLNYSGCGNTVNCNHPVVRDMVLDSLRYWVMEMHVDGFRFDLASILGRGRDGSVLPNPPLLERIASDPVLAGTKLIAEAWDAAGLYQVGSFPAWGRWAEWNGRFRDDIRKFVKSDEGMVPALVQRMLGSPDLYRESGRGPSHSINFVTCHDGFTLNDLVSYNEKHNEMNGEDNRDGANDNLSWNCGWEGPAETRSSSVALHGHLAEVVSLRRRQIRNHATLLMLSRGVPMILGGDEIGRTQQGNNNAYCQDNEVSWVDWGLARANSDLLRFFRLLIGFRKRRRAFRFASFECEGSLVGCPVEVHGVKLHKPDYSAGSRSVALRYREDVSGPYPGVTDIYLIANSYWDDLEFELPALGGGRTWRRAIDTSLPSPEDIMDPGEEPPLADPSRYRARSRSVVVLLGV